MCYLKMCIVGVDLVRPLQPWDILLIYCNNQLKKYITPLLRLSRGALYVPFLMSMSEAFSVPFYTLIKLCYTKALEWSSLVPGPKAKSSSEITNLTSFTVSYQGQIRWQFHNFLNLLKTIELPGGGNGNPLRYSCLENPMDKGACWAVVYGIAKLGYYWATVMLKILQVRFQ